MNNFLNVVHHTLVPPVQIDVTKRVAAELKLKRIQDAEKRLLGGWAGGYVGLGGCALAAARWMGVCVCGFGWVGTCGR